MSNPVRVLHAIHDFLPRHRAGSEIYAYQLCRQLQREHHVTVLCAEYDPGRRHGTVTWREFDGLPVVEIVNNWVFDSFEEMYQSSLLNQSLEHVLRAVGPDVLHIHNLFNLTFDLPAIARRLGIPSVATLHDYTVLCPSGGQRVHMAEQHICDIIDPDRCSRCFPQSPFYPQMLAGRLTRRSAVSKPAIQFGTWLRRYLPGVAASAQSALTRMDSIPVSPADIRGRLDKAKEVFDVVDQFVAPSRALAAEYRRFGIPDRKLRVSDYGFVPFNRVRSVRRAGPLRIGFVGTLVWHKGVHVLIEAVKDLPPDAYELKIFGDQKVFWNYSTELQRQAAGLPVRFMGGFESAEAASVYAQLDVLVVPSLWPENSPLVIHEAYMVGVPVVGSRQGGIPDLVTDGVNGLTYDAFSRKALGQALRRLIDEPSLLQAFAARLPHVKTIEEDAREWNEVYITVIEKNRLAQVQ